jgi:hypothetical protein
MALVFCDGFDHYAIGQVTAKYNSVSVSATTLNGPGRVGYGQYINVGGANFVGRGISPLSTLTVGAACYIPGATLPVLGVSGLQFQDSSANNLAYVSVGPVGQLYYQVVGGATYQSSPGILNSSAWFYLEVQVTLSGSTSGSLTVRLNGTTVISQSSVVTAGGSAGACAMVALSGVPSGNLFWDDFYVLNNTAPNNTFFGDVKIYPIYPAGNGRISGFSRFGGTSSGNYTAVNENPPDGDTSYVYSAASGTEDAYTLTALSNVATVKAVQLNGYVRKDDTPSHVVSLGVGNGTTESFDSGTSVNTSYTYILRQLDQNPLTSANWAVSDFTTLQGAVKLIS